MEIKYFDNAATSWPKPQGFMNAIADYNELIGANPGRSGHRLSIEAQRIIYDARAEIASLISAKDPLTIVFMSNATEALNTALQGLLGPGDHVITSGMEHNSVMRPLRFLESTGLELTVVPCSGKGELDPGDINKYIKRNTRAICLTHASNVTGSVMPVEEAGKIAAERDIVFCVDAAQTAGSIKINVEEMNIDLLAFTGHKSLMGPQGTGGLYVRKGLDDRIRPLKFGGTGSMSEFEHQPDFMPDRFESGTPNTHGIAGLHAGLVFIRETGIDVIRKKEEDLTELFLKGLADIEGVNMYGPDSCMPRAPVVSFNVQGMDPAGISFDLDERSGIMSRPGLHCAPAAHKTIGTFPQGAVRFSFGYFNTMEEIIYALDAINTIIRKGGS